MKENDDLHIVKFENMKQDYVRNTEKHGQTYKKNTSKYFTRFFLHFSWVVNMTSNAFSCTCEVWNLVITNLSVREEVVTTMNIQVKVTTQKTLTWTNL